MMLSSCQTCMELDNQFLEVIHDIMDAIHMTVTAMEDLRKTVNIDTNMDVNMNVADFEGMRDEIKEATLALNEFNAAIAKMEQPVINTAPFEPVKTEETMEAASRLEQPRSPPTPSLDVWNARSVEVFTDTGIERFQLEVQSANNMLGQLCAIQDNIAKQAYNTNIFPPEAFRDLISLATRIDIMRDRIKRIGDNPVNMKSDAANAQMEQLRTKLSQVVGEQSKLSQAMQNMDVSAASAAYSNLSQTVGNTEQYIRDNVNAQGRFNQEINKGSSLADGLFNKIKRYISKESVEKVMDLSDQMVQTEIRLGLIVDEGSSVDELEQKIFTVAQNTRAPFQETADMISKLGAQASKAFSSNDELLFFTEQLNKSFVVAGTSAEGVKSVMSQITQAMETGNLQEGGLDSILENAQPIVDNIQKYLEEVHNIDASNIKQLASEGVLTAEIIKNAMFYAAGETNAKFEEMPMTWGQIWQSMQNTAIMAFQPVLQRLNDIANSEAFQTFVNGAIEAMATLANIVLNIFDLISTVTGFIADNWSIISPIIYGVIAALAAYLAISAVVAVINGVVAVSNAVKAAADMMATGATFAQTVAQHGLNAALAACPLTWIILLIIALIAVIFALCNWIAKVTGAADSGIGIICGALSVAVAFIGNIFVALINMVIDIFTVFWNFIAAFVNFFGNVFTDPIGAVARLFFDLVDCVLGLLQMLASAIDTLFGSNLAESVQGWRDDLGGWVDETFGQGEEIMTKIEGADWHVDRFEYGEAWDAGTEFGDGIAEAIDDFNLSDIFGSTDIPNPEDYTPQFEGMEENLGGISEDTRSISDAMEVTQEDLKYLRDIAEQEAVNRYTIAEISIDQSGMQNTIKNGDDLDGFISGLTDATNEAVDIITEGVHE